METLNDLSDEKLEHFKVSLPVIVSQKDLPDIFWMLRRSADRADTVDLMVQTYGQQSLELTREVLEKMNGTDLVQSLSKSSSGETKKTKNCQITSSRVSHKWLINTFYKL